MKRIIVTGLVAALWASAATAADPYQKCYSGRADAKAKYEQCVGKWLAKVYAGAGFYGETMESKLSKCREKYAAAWTKLTALATAPCTGSRYTSTATTVTDNLTGLTWEKKTGPSDSAPNLADPHDVDNQYTWTTSDGDTTDEDGDAFTDFLTNLNAGAGFAGANGWRLPTLAELLTLFNQPDQCATQPCIDAVFGATQSSNYWSATTIQYEPTGAWSADFVYGYLGTNLKYGSSYVRGVRGGL